MISKMLLRPSRPEDLDGILQLASQKNVGLTTLSNDEKTMAARIAVSTTSFKSDPHKPGGEIYFFVLEDTETGKIVGTTGMVSKTGGYEPHWTYKRGFATHSSDFLNVHKEIPTLNLNIEHNGPSEIGTLFLAPECRHSSNGRLLSLSRFMFLAEEPHRFEPTIIAEMRGVVDKDGESAFWNALGHFFFDVDFPKADALAVRNKTFIADLMPRHPIYIPLLPKDAQEVIGQVEGGTKAALRLLEKEGFKDTGEVDIFDAGPVVSALVKNIRTVRCSECHTLIDAAAEIADTKEWLISCGKGYDFRATVTKVAFVDGGIAIPEKAAGRLKVTSGDTLRIAPLREER